MLRIISNNLKNNISKISSRISTRYLSTQIDNEVKEFMVFPRESEGNDYSVNWSLNLDGIAPIGKTNAYRNARMKLLSSHLPSKAVDNVVTIKSNSLFNKNNTDIKEAGDNMTTDDYLELKSSSNEYLSSSGDIFIEDGALGTQSSTRVGTRIVTTNPTVATIARSLLIPIPHKDCDHRKGFNGWNRDPTWDVQDEDMVWSDKTQQFENMSTPNKLKGDRAVTAFIGSHDEKSTTAALQFISHESNDPDANDTSIVGANVVVGNSSSIYTLISSLITSSVVVCNEFESSALALPSIMLNNGKLLIDCNSSSNNIDAIQDGVDAALKKKILYGPYANILTSNGVSAMFGGVVTDIQTGQDISKSTLSYLNDNQSITIAVDGKTVVPIVPDNLTKFPTEIVLVGNISEDKANETLMEVVGESKSELVATLLKSVRVTTAKTFVEAI